MSRDAFAQQVRDDNQREDQIDTERRERAEDREHAAQHALLRAADPDLLEASIEAAGGLIACVEIMRKLGHVRTADAARVMHDKLLRAIVKATVGEIDETPAQAIAAMQVAP